MDRMRALGVVGEIAADQWGLFTTAQANGAGVDRTTLSRLTEAGFVEQVSRGVHLVVAAGTPSNLEVKAAWLRLAPSRRAWERRATDEDGGVLSHRTACVLHELGDIPAPRVEMTVPRRRTTRVAGVRLHRGSVSEDEVTTRDGLPVTTVERTIMDLLAARVDGGHLGGVVADAMRRKLIDVNHLADRMATHAPAYGIPRPDGRHLLRHLLDQAGAGATVQQPEPNTTDATIRAIATRLAELDASQLEALRDAVATVAASKEGETTPGERHP